MCVCRDKLKDYYASTKVAATSSLFGKSSTSLAQRLANSHRDRYREMAPSRNGSKQLYRRYLEECWKLPFYGCVITSITYSPLFSSATLCVTVGALLLPVDKVTFVGFKNYNINIMTALNNYLLFCISRKCYFVWLLHVASSTVVYDAERLILLVR